MEFVSTHTKTTAKVGCEQIKNAQHFDLYLEATEETYLATAPKTECVFSIILVLKVLAKFKQAVNQRSYCLLLFPECLSGPQPVIRKTFSI